jgi:hypothetical protein
MILRTRSSVGLGWVLGVAILAVACDSEPVQTNRPPSRPLLSGPGEVAVGQTAEFSVTVYDPDGGAMRVYVAWGDGDTTDYGDFVYSHQAVTFEHTFDRADTFEVRARCHDLEPLFSDWSMPLTVVVVSR